MTDPDKCNIIDVLIVRIIVLVDDESIGVVALTIAVQIDVTSINSPQSVVLSGQILLFRVGHCIMDTYYSPNDAMSSGEHPNLNPVLIQDAAAATVRAEPLQGNQGGVFTLGCIGAVYDAVLTDRLLKTLRHGCTKIIRFYCKLKLLFSYPERQWREPRCRWCES
jgi:hypothetical protein